MQSTDRLAIHCATKAHKEMCGRMQEMFRSTWHVKSDLGYMKKKKQFFRVSFMSKHLIRGLTMEIYG